MDRALLLYDGLCGFCNGTVQWMLKHDRTDRFRFAPQQTAFAQTILQRHGLAGHENTAFLVLDSDSPQERVLVRSDVTAQALLLFGGVWGVLGRCLQMVPTPLRDWGYRIVANNRYRISGRYETCPLPSVEDRRKFLAL